MVSSKRAAEKIIDTNHRLEIVIETDEILVKSQKIVSKAFKDEPLELVKDMLSKKLSGS